MFYLRLDGTLVGVEVADGSKTFSVGSRRPLFPLGTPAAMAGNRYQVAREGRAFLVSVAAGPARAEPINVVINWLSSLNLPIQ
jgi:hypothetical protein